MIYTLLNDIKKEVSKSLQKENKFLELYWRNQKTYFLLLGDHWEKYFYKLHNKKKELLFQGEWDTIIKVREKLMNTFVKVEFLKTKDLEIIDSFKFSEIDTFSEIVNNTKLELSVDSNYNVEYQLEKDILEDIFLKDKNNFLKLQWISKKEDLLFLSSLNSFSEEMLDEQNKDRKKKISIKTMITSKVNGYINNKKKKRELNNLFKNWNLKKYLLESQELKFYNIPRDLVFLTVTNRNLEILIDLIEISKNFRKWTLREIPHFIYSRYWNISDKDVEYLNSLWNKSQIFFKILSPLSSDERKLINLPFWTNNNSNVWAERRDSLNDIDLKYKDIITFDDNITNVTYVSDYNVQEWNMKKNFLSSISIFKDIYIYRKFIWIIIYKDYDFFTIPSHQQFNSVHLSPISKISTGFLKFKRDLNINFLPLSLTEDRDFWLQYIKSWKEIIISDIFFFKKKKDSKKSWIWSSVYQNRTYLEWLKKFYERRYHSENLSCSIRKWQEWNSLSMSSSLILKGIKYQK